MVQEHNHQGTSTMVDESAPKVALNGKDISEAVLSNATETCAPVSEEPEMESRDVGRKESSDVDEISAKERGNQAFFAGNFEEAVEHWTRGVKTCNYLLSKNVYDGEQKQFVEDLLCTLNGNLSLGYLKLQNYYRCIEKADLVLEMDPKNVKALYRKAEAFLFLGNFQKSLESVQAVLAEDSSNKAAQNLKARACREALAARDKERRMMQKFVASIESNTPAPSFFTQSWTTVTGWICFVFSPVFYTSLMAYLNTMARFCKRRRRHAD